MQQLSTRSQALQEPVYATFRQRAAPAKQAHIQALEGTWEEALLDCKEVNYLGNTLAPLLAYEALAADTKQYHPRDVWLGSHEGVHTFNDAAPSPGQAPTAEEIATQAMLEALGEPDLHTEAALVEDVSEPTAAWRKPPPYTQPHHSASTHSAPLHVEEGNPQGYATRHKKGNPLPKCKLVRDMVARSAFCIGVVGPDFVGITTLLQGLQHAGYTTTTLGDKPPPDQRTTFQWAHFQRMVQAWQQLPDKGPALLVEDTPWAYLARHSVHIEASVRQEAHHTLAPLTLPAFHIVLHTTGVTVGRRHPTLHTTPKQHSPHALRQMGLLAHLPSPTFHVDATAAPEVVCTRV